MQIKKKHLWRGEWIDDAGLADHFANLADIASLQAGIPECTPDVLLPACERLCQRITRNDLGDIPEVLKDHGESDEDISSILNEVADFIRPANVLEKVQRELGSSDPWIPKRPYASHPCFEAWKPLGILVHITPSNALSVAPMSVVEGLMAGNINILKNSSRNGIFAQAILKMLLDEDESGILKNYIYVFEVSSKDEEKMDALYAIADGISVWGGEDAVKAVREKVPSGVRFIDWGHKISFGYVTEALLDDNKTCEAFARDICLIDQQACSSPQSILVETTDRIKVDLFAECLFGALKRISPVIPGKPESIQERAEITARTHLHRAEVVAGNGKIYEDPAGKFRVLVDYRKGLSPSPLYRTIWIHPLVREEIVPVLHPMNIYLQTCGLACREDEFKDICNRLTRAGVIRITEPGRQLQQYTGAPHDAVYALQRFSKRVSYQPGEKMREKTEL